MYNIQHIKIIVWKFEVDWSKTNGDIVEIFVWNIVKLPKYFETYH